MLTQDNNSLNWSSKARKYNTAAIGAFMSTQSCTGLTLQRLHLRESCAQSPRASFQSSLTFFSTVPRNCNSVDAIAKRSGAVGRPGRLWIRAPFLYDFGNESILWRPSVHGAAMGTLGKCYPVGQLIDFCQIDIDVRGDQSVRVRASEHQLCQWSLHQSPGVEGRSLCDSGQAERSGNRWVRD